MIIDTHIHIIVPEILREAAPEEGWRPHVFWENDRQVIDFGGKQIRSAIREFVHIEKVLEDQDSAGIDRVLLCPWVSLLRYNAEAEEGRRVSMIYNEALASLAEKYPSRITPLGTVPLQAPALASRMLEDLMAGTPLRGVEIAASVNGIYLGDDRFREFWSTVESTGAFVFIHPTTRGFGIDVLDEYYLWNTVGNPLETTITAAHLVMSGVMGSYPGLKIMLAHGGGALTSLRGRLRHAHTFQPQARSRLKESPAESIKRFYFDTVTHDPDVLKTLIDTVGVDHVLLGSDYPFDMGDLHPTEIVRGLELSEADTGAILGGNAAHLLNLEA